MNDLCITTVVTKEYFKYIPWFCTFINISYPDYHIKLFCLDDYKEKNNFKNTEIIDTDFRNFPKSNQELKTIRWILPYRYFKNFKYVYIGDIDIFIVREVISLHVQHIENMIKHKTCISNIERPCGERMSGLHFFEVEKYYDKMNNTIFNYCHMLINGILKDKKNECTLYHMLKEANIKIPTGAWRPFHGPHIGIWRKPNPVLSEEKWKAIGGREQNKEYYNKFKAIKKQINLPELQEFKYMKQCMDKITERSENEKIN